MSHLREEDLILLQYGEAEDVSALEAHLAACSDCRAVQQDLQTALAAAEVDVPERGADYGAQVWARLAPQLPQRQRLLRFPTPRTWVALLASAAALVAAFQTGRHWPAEVPQQQATTTAPVRERILLVAVGDHLQRSQMVLVELANAKDSGPLDISIERDVAQNLVANSRLYRQTAAIAGDNGVASVLDDLERVLLEIANGPQTLSSRELVELQKRIESKGILFKVKVLGSQVREREKTAVRERAGTAS